jgi:hypothetical protein
VWHRKQYETSQSGDSTSDITGSNLDLDASCPEVFTVFLVPSENSKYSEPILKYTTTSCFLSHDSQLLLRIRDDLCSAWSPTILSFLGFPQYLQKNAGITPVASAKKHIGNCEISTANFTLRDS